MFMEKYFISKGHFYKFTLVELEGGSRMDLLGINPLMIGNPKRVNKWYEEIRETLESSDLLDEKTLEILEGLRMEML